MKRVITLAFLFCFFIGFAQDKPKLFFEDGARVCFVGNSITHAGEYHHNILLFHLTRFPGKQITFYNCGIAGDIASGVLRRIDDDILVNHPTHAVIMLGMNDVFRNLYIIKGTSNADTISWRKMAINTYKTNYEKIINIFLAKNINVILQKPTIYDQSAVLPSANNYGVNDALWHCANFIDTIARKYNLPVVDYYTIMNTINARIQKKDPSATITGKDRVHPGPTGHLIMTYQFLKTENAPRYVSKITINNNPVRSSQMNYNCEISKISANKHEATFQVKENALPFPFAENQDEGLKLVPFVNEFNIELLQVLNLNPDNYQLSIDNHVIGNFTNRQFKKGINIAAYKNTPQNTQAMKLRERLNELWLLEGKLRALKFIECSKDFMKCPNKEDLAYLKIYLDSVFSAQDNSNYFKMQVEKYIKNKPMQKEFEDTTKLLRKEAFEMSKPEEHQFKVIRVRHLKTGV